MTRRLIRRLLWAAYEQGWRDACQDHMIQRGTPTRTPQPDHPIGESQRQNVDALLRDLDPYNLTGLLGSRQ